MLTKPGKGRVFVMSVPFETINGERRRDTLMKQILKVLDEK